MNMPQRGIDVWTLFERGIRVVIKGSSPRYRREKQAERKNKGNAPNIAAKMGACGQLKVPNKFEKHHCWGDFILKIKLCQNGVSENIY
jgi:hypothetical protein